MFFNLVEILIPLLIILRQYLKAVKFSSFFKDISRSAILLQSIIRLHCTSPCSIFCTLLITARSFCRKSTKIIEPFFLLSVRINLAISKLELVYGDS